MLYIISVATLATDLLEKSQLSLRLFLRFCLSSFTWFVGEFATIPSSQHSTFPCRSRPGPSIGNVYSSFVADEGLAPVDPIDRDLLGNANRSVCLDPLGGPHMWRRRLGRL